MFVNSLQHLPVADVAVFAWIVTLQRIHERLYIKVEIIVNMTVPSVDSTYIESVINHNNIITVHNVK